MILFSWSSASPSLQSRYVELMMISSQFTSYKKIPSLGSAFSFHYLPAPLWPSSSGRCLPLPSALTCPTVSLQLTTVSFLSSPPMATAPTKVSRDLHSARSAGHFSLLIGLKASAACGTVTHAFRGAGSLLYPGTPPTSVCLLDLLTFSFAPIPSPSKIRRLWSSGSCPGGHGNISKMSPVGVMHFETSPVGIMHFFYGGVMNI